jgi:pyridoxamine 5'-phosphate oxidase
MWAPFLESARRSIVLAQEAAQRYGGDQIGTEHITLGVLEVDESPLLPLFEERGLSIDAYRERIQRNAAGLPASTEMFFTINARRLLELSFERGRELNTNYIAAEHLVLAVTALPDSMGAKYLIDLGFDLGAIASRMLEQVLVVQRPVQPDLRMLRRSYTRAALNERDVDRDPLAQLQRWITDAAQTHIVEPNAMCVSTADEQGRPSSRMVLLRGLDQRGLIFYTSYSSRKGTQLAKNPFAALLFFWPELERQVRIEGAVEQVAEDEADAYFASRPRGHQLAAWASEQSEPVESQALLAQRVEDYAARFEGEDVPRPHSWGGFLVRPARIEFWQGRENRLHDRLEFTKEGTSWKLQRLSP